MRAVSTATSAASALAIPATPVEELVAELGAAFLCADLGITPEPREDHASYLAHWLEILREDKRAIFSSAAHAQRAVDFLHGLSAGVGETPEPAVAEAPGRKGPV